MKTLKYAIRFLLRSKSYTLINLLGLAFSLACCIILMRYIHRELTVDTHCVDREQVYATVVTMEGNRGLSGISDIQYDKVQI
ncbi:MAG: ABC transporter permease, partial [Bacteroidaceae bacterium]|nr:ABC transporter permease [Bacteroidaceae bacterium]